MAIQFARLQYVSRSNGGNACRKAAYNMRDVIKCERTGTTFNFSSREGLLYHEILLPEGANLRFKDPKVLWNEAEYRERRINSQVCKEMVLALPDNPEVTNEMRIEITQGFIKENYVDKGLAAQIDIHIPDDGSNNWHAHVLITTRRFHKDGNSLGKKARDLDPIFKKSAVMEATDNGLNFKNFLEKYFKEKGLEITVDPISIFPQEHIGPIRFRRKNSELVEDLEVNKAVNENLFKDPEVIILYLLERKAYFTEEDLNHLLKKHYPKNELETFKKEVLSHKSLIPLFDKETREHVNAWTSKEIREEENKILRFAAKVFNKSYKPVKPEVIKDVVEARTLKPEQEIALRQVVETKSGLSFIQGKAGTGKSHVMNAIRETYEKSGYRVVGLSPSQMVAEDMKNAGFKEAYNVHSFLYSRRYKNKHPDSKTILIVDEAAMISNPTLLETIHVANVHNCKIVMLGDTRQLDAVSRGGMYRYLLDHYGASNLDEIVRQKVAWQKEVNEEFSNGNITRAVQILNKNKRIMWSQDLEESQTELIKSWTRNSIQYPDRTRVVITNKNEDVDTLNKALRQVMQLRGLVSTDEYGVEIRDGYKEYFAKGDRICFTEINKSLKVNNGEYGTLINASTNSFTVLKDSGDHVTFDPKAYKHIALGYAGTIYKAQGKTVGEAYLLATKSISKSSGYVSLSRQTEEIYVFANYEHTRHVGLISQLSRDNTKLASLTYATAEDLIEKGHTFFDRALEKIEKVSTAIKDFAHYNREFYSYHKPKEEPLSTITYNDKLKELEEANKAAERQERKLKEKTTHHETMGKEYTPSPSDVDSEVKGVNLLQEDLASKDEQKLSTGVLQGNNAVRKEQSIEPKNLDARHLHTKYIDTERLDAKVINKLLQHKAREVAEYLLGEPNKHLSDERQLRFGNKGSLSISIAGEKAGLFHNFETGESGNLITLIQKEKNMNFKEALQYASTFLGHKVPQREEDRFRDIKSKQKNQAELEARDDQLLKCAKVNSIIESSAPIENTLAERYLREHRGIKAELPASLKYKNHMFEPGSQQSLPALIAEARDGQGTLTAIQAIYLDKASAKKATIDITKRSYGSLKGSFVEIQTDNKEVPNRVYVAEGVETALSLKEAGIKDPIYAALGVSNYKNIGFFLETKYKSHYPEVIIAADHDKGKGEVESPSSRTTNQALEALRTKGFKASLIKPHKEGYDFNDVLLKQGSDALKDQVTVKEVNPLKSLEDKYFKHALKIYEEHGTGSFTDKDYRFAENFCEVMAREVRLREIISGRKVEDKDVLFVYANLERQKKTHQHILGELTKEDKKCLFNWMMYDLEAKRFAAIEGNLYEKLKRDGEKENSLTLNMIKHQAKSKSDFLASERDNFASYLQKYGPNKDLNFAVNESWVYIKGRYGNFTKEASNIFDQTVNSRAHRFEQIQSTQEAQFKAGPEQLSSEIKQFVDQGAIYRTSQEITKVFEHRMLTGAMPTPQEMKKIEDDVQKFFEKESLVYGKQTQLNLSLSFSKSKGIDMEM
jgi:Ti-type conjugative transfer relaxase TraA